MRARRLKKLRIKRVDLVERGANQGAEVVLFKAAQVCQKCNTPIKAGDKFCAGCGMEFETKAAKAAERKDDDMAENTELMKKLQDDLDAATARAKQEAEKREAVEKSLKEQGESLASLQKRLEESEAEIKKAKDEVKLTEFKKAIERFEHLPLKADVFGPVLKKASEVMSEDEYKEFMRVLKAADAAASGNFSEIGAPGHDTNPRSAAEEIEAKAEELVSKSSGKLEKNAAIAQVMTQNPRLAERARRESYSARAES